MIRDDGVRKKFDKKAGKPDKKPLAAFAKIYGWDPPAELAEWQGIVPGYRACFYEISDVWMVGGDLSGLKKKVEIGKLINSPMDTITMLTGLVPFGDDPSGDSSYVSTLPHERDLAEVHVYNHENGEMDGTLYYSMADFIVSCWGEEDEHAAAMKAFNKVMEPERKKWSAHQDPRALFNRVKWMWSLSSGETSYHFAEDMERAPSFADWEKEKPLLAKKLVLANYWMLAHYFLGNEAACREACAAVKKAKGAITPGLAKMMLALLDAPKKAKLGKLKPAQLDELRASVRKNADERLLDPKGAAEVKAQRSMGVTKADAKDIAKRLQAGEDGWALIAEFPDDVEAHALLLKKMGAKDKKLEKFLKDFEAQKTKEVYDEWPSKWEADEFDRRIAPCVGALFRAGLAYDADHKRACASFVRTLAWLDDDAAMDGFAQAIEKLRMDDDRHEYLVGALAKSKHPRARDLLDRAAWRFFDFFDATAAKKEKREARGPTLDDIFAVDSHLLQAVIASIRLGDDASEKLVDKVCSIRSNMTVLGIAYAAAFKQVGQKKLERHLGILGGYCKAVDGFESEFLPDYACYNLVEAAIAGVKLSPDNAPKVLREMLEKKRDSEQLHLDIAGCVLGGLLIASPDDPEILKWTERILGNRTLQDRVYGPLRGVAEAKIEPAKEWCRYHVYANASSLGMGQKFILQNAARAALVALGEPEPPPFDTTNEYATKTPIEELPQALLHPEKHNADSIFKRIVEKKYQSPEVVRIGAKILEDAFRWSSDDRDPFTYCEERKEGLACMLFQGEPALPMLAPLLDLPNMAGAHKTLVLYTMSVITNAPRVIVELVKTKNILPLVEKTPPEMLGALGIVCGFAHAVHGDAAKDASTRAIERRFAWVSPGSDHWVEQEPTALHLIMLARRIGGKALLKELGKLDNHHTRQVLEYATKADIETVTEHVPVLLGFKRPDYSDPVTTCSIALDGSAVNVGWKVDDLHFQGIPNESSYQQHASASFGSPDEARSAADTIARALNAIGFAPPPKPIEKPKGKKR